MNSPTFLLPACPACSSIHAITRPYWHHCRNTSKKEKIEIYAFNGCEHAMKCGGNAAFVRDPAEWARIEADWLEVTIMLFDFKTQGWSEHRVEALRRKLNDRVEASLPGATMLMDLGDADSTSL